MTYFKINSIKYQKGQKEKIKMLLYHCRLNLEDLSHTPVMSLFPTRGPRPKRFEKRCISSTDGN